MKFEIMNSIFPQKDVYLKVLLVQNELEYGIIGGNFSGSGKYSKLLCK